MVGCCCPSDNITELPDTAHIATERVKKNTEYLSTERRQSTDLYSEERLTAAPVLTRKLDGEQVNSVFVPETVSFFGEISCYV
jgi:hypothetical protein